MRNVSAPFEGSGASTMRRYKLAMVLCRASETTRASARRSTCCHCGLCRCKCKPYTKASSLGECCTMSLSKGISFLLYALVGTPSVHGYPLVFNLGYAQNSPASKWYVEFVDCALSVCQRQFMQKGKVWRGHTPKISSSSNLGCACVHSAKPPVFPRKSSP